MSDGHGYELCRDADGDADTEPPGNGIWFVLVERVTKAATCCSTGDKAATQDPSTEYAENEENAVATQDPYMTIPRMPWPPIEKETEKEKKKKKKRRRNGAL